MTYVGCVSFILYYVLLMFGDTDSNNNIVRICLTGDVMLGSAVDHILKYPSDPKIPPSPHYPRPKSVLHYIEIAEKINGKIPSREITSQADYIWGDMIQSLKYYQPDIKLFNLETTITSSEHYWPKSGYWFKLNPKNIYILNKINNDGRLVCNLANNHMLDWGYQGLNETFQTLTSNNILFCGAGPNTHEAWKPAVIELEDKNCTIFIFGIWGTASAYWQEMAAGISKSGIAMINPYNYRWRRRKLKRYIEYIMKIIKKYVMDYNEGRYEGQAERKNIIILSMHWGANWNWTISDTFKQFAHMLIDYNDANRNRNRNDIGIDLIHGHGSHHIKGIEIYKNKAIFYGCGDIINDYEGEDRRYEWKNDLGFMYYIDLNISTGNIHNMILKGTQIKRFQITYAQNESLIWLQDTMKMLCDELKLNLHVNVFDQTLRLNYPHIKKNRSDVQMIINNKISIEMFATSNLTYYLYWSLFITIVVFCGWFIRKKKKKKKK
eukprot:322151_1